MGVGKTTAIKFFEEYKFSIFIMDQYIHKIYQKNEIGYQLIKKHFGVEFVNVICVDRTKLRKYILKNNQNLEKLNNLIFPIIEKQLDFLIKTNIQYVVELGIYIYNHNIFAKYFNKVIIITANRENIIDFFKNIHGVLKFSTKCVEKYENTNKKQLILADYIVENNESESEFKKKIIEIIQKIKNRI